MNDSRRAKLIADVIKHLEGLDADELGSKMAPPAPLDEAEGKMGDEGDKGPMEVAIEVEGKPEGDEPDDEELEELSKLSM